MMKIYERSLKTGEKAYAIDEVPIGCVIVQTVKSSQEDITGATLIKIRLPMQNCLPSAKQVKNR